MPPRTTSTSSCSTSFLRLGRDGVVGRAVLEVQLEVPAEQAALGVDVADDHPGDVGVREPDERERARLVGDDSHLDGIAAGGGDAVMSSLAVALAVAPERELRRVVGAIVLGRPAPIHREDSPSSTHRSASVSSSPRWRSRRTTRSASRSSRSCARACSRRGSARPRASTRSCATTAYWVALLRYIGCTGHAHEVATLFGDEIAIRGQTLVHDAGNPAEVMRDVMAFATAGRSAGGARRDRPDDPGDGPRVGGRTTSRPAARWPTCSSSGSTSAPTCARRCASRSSAGTGTATPTTRRARRSRSPMRIVHLSHDMEAIGRLFSPERALEAARERRDETYDPALADLFLAHGRDWFERARPRPSRGTPCSPSSPSRTACWRAPSSTTPSPSPPTSSTSSRRTWAGTAAAARSSPSDAARRARARRRRRSTTLRRAALVHDFGTTVVPNSIWDKPGPLTRSEFDRVELHPMLTEQMLRRSPALAVLNPVASAHHEKCDGSGYHKRVQADADDLGACVLAATEVYVGLTTERADRPPFSARRRGRRAAPARVGGRARAAREPCGARGRGARRAARRRTGKRPQNPGGLTRREVEVLRLAAEGPHDARDRRPALHLAQDRRPPHPAHLRQDRRVDAGRRGAVGDAAHRRPVIVS